MGFTNLYTKSTANPKEIDFAKVGTIVKNKIPEAAIKAFQAKVPGVQPKPFEFKFDKDYDTGKLQIAVAKMGFVFGWVDASFAANKTKMGAVEKEIDAWKARMELSIQSVGKYRADLIELNKKVAVMEAAVAADKVDAAMVKENQAVKTGLQNLMAAAQGERTSTLQFLNGAPKEGVVGLMKKHGLPVEQIGGEKKEADADFAAFQQLVKKFTDQFTAVGTEFAKVSKQADDVGVKLFGLQNMNRDRKSELADMTVAIQKDIGDFQGQKNSDFAAVDAKGLLQEAKEFTGKAGKAWTELSGDAGAIDKKVAQVEQVFQTMRIRAGGVAQQYQAWQKPAIPRGGDMKKYQDMLKGVYDEYMVELNTLQDALRGYKDALLKQKPKAVELAAKAVKTQAKSDVKVQKEQAKIAVKQAKASGDVEAKVAAKAAAKVVKEEGKAAVKQAKAEVKAAKKGR